MKILQGEVKKWEDFRYDSDDNIDGDFDDYSFESTKRAISEESFEEGFLLKGVIRRWNGAREMLPLFVNDLEEVINSFKDTDSLTVDFENEGFTVVNNHHDGTNTYRLVPLKWYTIKELKEEYNLLDDDEYFEKHTGKILKKISRVNLVEFLQEEFSL